MTGKNLFCALCILTSGIAFFNLGMGQTAGQAESASAFFQNQKSIKNNITVPSFLDFENKGISAIHKIGGHQETRILLKKKLDRQRARNFFLVAIGSAILLWAIYLAVYFVTIDATASSLLIMIGGLSGILGIIAIAVTLIGFIVWMIAINQGW